MDDLRALAGDLHAEGMSLCVDLVINHTAREHEWAQRAIAGEEEFPHFANVAAKLGMLKRKATAITI